MPRALRLACNGLRQLRRSAPLETTEINVRGQCLRVPTLSEILRIKGWLTVSRNATRDYLDLAALSVEAGLPAAARCLAELDRCYRTSIAPATGAMCRLRCSWHANSRNRHRTTWTKPILTEALAQ